MFLWLYYLHLSMNPLYQLFPSVIKFAEHYRRNRRNAMFYQSSLRELEASYNHNCKGSLLQVSVLICKLSLSKIHTWCQGIECKNAIWYNTETRIIKFDRLTNEKGKDNWQTQEHCFLRAPTPAASFNLPTPEFPSPSPHATLAPPKNTWNTGPMFLTHTERHRKSQHSSKFDTMKILFNQDAIIFKLYCKSPKIPPYSGD